MRLRLTVQLNLCYSNCYRRSCERGTSESYRLTGAGAVQDPAVLELKRRYGASSTTAMLPG
jgi:hypothetical protein